jgi:hypothetical protein
MALRRPTIEFGVFGRKTNGGASASDLVAAALSLIWLVFVAGVYLFTDGAAAVGPLMLILTLLAVFLPLVVIWVVASVMRSVATVRGEAARLQAAVDALRQAYLSQQQTAATGGMRADVEKKLDEIVAAQRKTETAIAMFTSRRDAARIVPSSDGGEALVVNGSDGDQPGLALGVPPDELRAPIDNPTFIRALNFPENTEDRLGFRALRLALEDPGVMRLVRAAQDVLTLLSEDGIYMDDLNPDRARPEIWRKFAAGERGGGIASLGGVRDRSSLALTSGRMKQDPVFRDAAHHFLRTFDKTFAAFEPKASDLEIAAFAETRTARAFMLVGRVAGTFD